MKVEESEDRVRNSGEPDAAGTPRGRSAAAFAGVLLIVLAALGWFIYKGIGQRVSAAATLVQESRQDAILTVSVTRPVVTGGTQELVLPGTTQPIMEASIYARVAGYLKSWDAEIGTRLKKGHIIAEIDAPDVDHQLLQARADLETAKANLALSEITADRLVSLLKQDAVAKQDVDNAVGDRNAKRSTVASMEANVQRLQDMQSFEKIYAPFDGVITARNTDVGALIDSSGAGKELFHLADTSRLRVFINVPEDREQDAKTGTKTTLTLNEFPGRQFPGTIVRNSNAIDPASRTLLVEVDADNTTGDLLPGAYVSVHVPVTRGRAAALTVPANTLLFRSEGLRAAVVRGGKAELLPIRIGRDFGDTLEVVSGLNPGEELIVNPPDSLVSGTPVRIGSSAAK